MGIVEGCRAGELPLSSWILFFVVLDLACVALWCPDVKGIFICLNRVILFTDHFLFLWSSLYFPECQSNPFLQPSMTVRCKIWPNLSFHLFSQELFTFSCATFSVFTQPQATRVTLSRFYSISATIVQRVTLITRYHSIDATESSSRSTESNATIIT